MGRWRKWVARVLMAVGFLSFAGGGVLFCALKYTQVAPAWIVRRHITSIFERHGYPVLWEGPVGADSLAPHIKSEIRRWSVETEGWQMPTKDTTEVMQGWLKPGTLVHVLEVKEATLHGLALAIFLLELPISLQRTAGEHILSSGQPLRSLDHSHADSMRYRPHALFGLWGDLAAFPLELQLPFDEVRERRQWVKHVRRMAKMFSVAVGAPCFFLGFFLLHLRYLCVFGNGVVAMARRVTLFSESLRTPAPVFLAHIDVDERNGGKSAHARDTVSFLLCVFAVLSVLEQERARDRQEQEAIRARIQAHYDAALDPQERGRLQKILNEFPGAKNLRLKKARALELRALQQKGAIVPEATPAPMRKPVIEVPARKHQGKMAGEKETAETNDVLSMPWLYGLFEDIIPIIQKLGGDPLVVSTILLYAFLRPGYREFIVQDNCRDVSLLRRWVNGKLDDVFRAFGRRISPEEIDRGFELLKKGGLILEKNKRERAGLGTPYSLNPHGRDARSPLWGEVIRITMRAADHIQMAGGKS